ncbi:MAG: hypothetical protein RIA71_12205 [Oceanicaulis sp.]
MAYKPGKKIGDVREAQPVDVVKIFLWGFGIGVVVGAVGVIWLASNGG